MPNPNDVERNVRVKNDSNDDDEYEESIFAVELHGLFDEESIQKAVDDEKCHVHRINSDEPLLQIGSQLFVGKWEEVIGTDMIFKEISHRHLLNFIGVNRKRMIAQRVVLVPKNKNEKEKSSDRLQHGETASNTERADSTSGNVTQYVEMTPEIDCTIK